MAISNKYKILFTVLLVTIVAAVFLWIRSYVFSQIGVTINKKIESLKVSGFNVEYDSLSVDWKKNIFEIYGLVLDRNAYDTACVYPEFISVAKVRAEGLRLFPLIINNVLDLEALYLDTPRVLMRENSLFQLDSTARRENEFTFRSDRVELNAANLKYIDSLHCQVISALQSNVAVEGLEMEFRIEKEFEYSADKVTLASSALDLPREFYSVRVRETTMDFLNEKLAMDSIRIIPAFGKIEFGRKLGYESDRFEGIIPFARVSDFSFSFLDSAWVKAELAEVQFFLKIFRDKRLPFKKVPKLLPIDALQSLPFGLLIDSLKITNSYVQYEEYPEEGSDAGGVFFDNLYAVLSNITNLSKSGHTNLRANAALMGRGKIAVAATFPLNRDQRSSISGSLQDFPIEKINPMLTPSTNIKVTSGQMHKLSFNFWFNVIRSDGEIELNYEDLKLLSYKEEDDENRGSAPEKDNLKTFIMNTFVFRKNMDEKVPEEKRTGTVMFERDNNRSIFNFWVKSLLSGIKSAYNLDKMAEKKTERENKKEERLAKRLERKQKKAEKKKDRG